MLPLGSLIPTQKLCEGDDNVRKIILILAAAAFVGATGAWAGSLAAKEDTIEYKIDAAVKTGEIDYDTSLMYRFFALTPATLDEVPERYHAEYYSEDWVSGTPVWLELQARWPRMRPQVQKKLIEVYGNCFGPTSFDSGKRFRRLDFPNAFETTSNYGGYPVFHYDSPPLYSKKGNFRIHWTEEGPNKIKNTADLNQNGVPDMIEDYAEAAEYAWKVYTEHDWFKHPDPQEQKYLPLKDYYPGIDYPPDPEYDYGGNDRWDIYLGQFQRGVVGMTTGDPFEFTETYRNDRTPYFLQRNEFVKTGSLPERVIVAHELNHGCQYMLDAVEASASSTPRWYFECSAMWGQNEVYPGDPDAINRANTFLGNTLRALDGTEDGGYMTVIWNFFLSDWESRFWKPPEWTPRPSNFWMVREVWRALSKGDEWYTKDPAVDRESREAVGFLAGYYQKDDPYLDGRACKDIFEYWNTWNWFTGTRDDGKHYVYGNRFSRVGLQNNWGPGDYPLRNYRPPTETYYMNHFGHGFYQFNTPPGTWPIALLTFAGDAGNADATKDWGGAVYVTKNGTTWTDLSGKQGQATPMFTPEDKGIIQIRNPGQYEAIVMILSNVANTGLKLPFEYSFIPADDARPPAVGAGVGLTQANPDYIEVLVGGDEPLFGKAEAEVWFTSDNGEKRAELISMSAAPGNRNFLGTFVMDMGDKGKGTLKWRAADMGGNIVSGQKGFNAGFLASGGGTVGGERASLKLPTGAVGRPTLFLISPREEAKKSAKVAAAAFAGGDGPAVETVGRSYEFGPGWARLAKAAEITLSYEGLEVAREDYLSVYRWNGVGWEDLGGTIDKRGRRVMAVADALGTFTLGYGEKKNTTPPAGKPMAFGLYQNYPNPARDDTVIKYTLPGACEVELVVYDLSGRRVSTVVREVREAGVHEESYALADDSGRPLPAGVYFYRLSAGADAATRKMVVAR
jgi:hypothetical protein